MTSSKPIKLLYATIYLEESNFVNIKLIGDEEIDLLKAKKIIKEVLKLVDNQPYYLLIDGKDVFLNIGHEAREYFASHKDYNELNIAKAMVSNNMPTSMIINFYKKFYPHQKPIQTFNNIKKAKEWLFEQG